MLVMPVRSWLAVSREAMVAVNSALRAAGRGGEQHAWRP